MIQLEHIEKSYNGLSVLRDTSLSFQDGCCYCLMSPSGSGKTTLLRILMGLEPPDSGAVRANGQDCIDSLTVSAVFQEDRLCESFTPLENVMMCTGRSLKPSRIRREMERLLPAECLDRPVSTLSGGMKRRVAVLRAMLVSSDVLLMDEPFTGMDEDLKRIVISYIKEMQGGRILILSTHQEEDVELIGGELIRLKQEPDSKTEQQLPTYNETSTGN